MRLLSAALVAVMHLSATSCSQAQSMKMPNADYLSLAQFETAKVAYDDQRYDNAYLMLVALMEPRMFDQFSTLRKYEVATMAGVAAYKMGDRALAHRAAIEATKLALATDRDWGFRLLSAVRANDGPDAMLAFRQLVQRQRGKPRPNPFMATFAAANIDDFDHLVTQLPDANRARLEVGRQLELEDWRSDFAYADPGAVWLHYAQALIADGQISKATEVVERITDPMVISAMHADKRFDPIIAANPRLQDVDRAAQDYLVQAQSLVRENPRFISARLFEIRALEVLQRSAEALAVVDEIKASIAKAPTYKPPFDDMYLVPHLAVQRGASLMSLGRVDEAIGSRTAVADQNNYAALALARSLVDVGRGPEALEWLSRVRGEELGLQAQMDLANLRACAATQQRDSEEVARQLDYLRANRRWKPEAVVRALLCSNQLDAASTEFLLQIRDPGMRLSALNALQIYAEDLHPTAQEKAMAEGWARLRARPEVMREVDAVGRINRFHTEGWQSVS